MYYVNREQIEVRLSFLTQWNEACRALRSEWKPGVSELAQERLLQIAIEIVTDVGSYMIDGYMMRDAGSYEDIVEILRGEQVIDDESAEILTRLVSLRKPLLQTYWDFPRDGLHPAMNGLERTLEGFASSVRAYLDKPI